MATVTILIAEDVPVDGLILRNILAHAGFQTVMAPDGKKALEALEAHPEVSLIVADVGMPEMTGVELVGAIREREEWAGLPVVFVSGAADAATVRSAVSLKPQGYILKPVTEPSRVLDRIHAALEGVVPVLEDEDVARRRGGLGSPEYRAACRDLAHWLRESLGEGEGEGGAASPTEGASLAGTVGARRLLRALEDGGGERPESREMRATLNVLQAAGF